MDPTICHPIQPYHLGLTVTSSSILILVVQSVIAMFKQSCRYYSSVEVRNTAAEKPRVARTEIVLTRQALRHGRPHTTVQKTSELEDVLPP